MNTKVIIEADTGIVRIEKVTMDAGYNNEQITVYLYFPRNARPPFQPVILYPGSNVIHTDVMDNSYLLLLLEWIIKSGRVLVFPVETSQIPMVNLLGTPEEDKKMIIYDTGHLVPKTELIKETLAWYDRYLGPVK